MSNRIQSIRGMHDILPDHSAAWRGLEDQIKHVLMAYGYREIRMPVVEQTELFSRSIGEVTDIVEKEMYTFKDRNGDRLSLRPEGTAGCVRAGVQHGLLHNKQQRLWYLGPMFRHERPQKDRYRQFHQVGVEAFGFEGPDIDAELIAMTSRLWRALGLENIRLELNSLGSAQTRSTYREKLIAYLSDHRQQLDDDSLRRLHSNPLRVLDSKNPQMEKIVENAPSLLDELDEESYQHFEELKYMLDALDVDYVLNPRLVRGLDYYCKTVFEWISDDLGSQGTVCAGGRYDGLVEQLGGRATSAAGFAMGMERLLHLLEKKGISLASDKVHAYCVLVGEEAERVGRTMIEALREELWDFRVIVNCGGGGFKAQLKRADRSGAQLALILGDDEIQEHTINVKHLRTGADQDKIPQSQIASYLRTALTLP